MDFRGTALRVDEHMASMSRTLEPSIVLCARSLTVTYILIKCSVFQFQDVEGLLAVGSSYS